MSNHATLSAALLAAFNLDTDKADPAAVADAAASVLVAFAGLVRGPAPGFSDQAVVELTADETPALILAEIRGLRADLAERAGQAGADVLAKVESIASATAAARRELSRQGI